MACIFKPHSGTKWRLEEAWALCPAVELGSQTWGPDGLRGLPRCSGSFWGMQDGVLRASLSTSPQVKGVGSYWEKDGGRGIELVSGASLAGVERVWTKVGSAGDRKSVV